ncbi:MAG TPA: hypothetical protein PK507_03080 [bacterium]|nr:hypothetical protein [bacterium]
MNKNKFEDVTEIIKILEDIGDKPLNPQQMEQIKGLLKHANILPDLEATQYLLSNISPEAFKGVMRIVAVPTINGITNLWLAKSVDSANVVLPMIGSMLKYFQEGGKK